MAGFGSLTGDLDALTRFGDGVGKLASTRVMTELSRELGNEVVKLIAKGFERERDPYGLPWFRKRFPDGRKVLRGETGKLARSFGIKSVSASGVVVGSNLDRSRFQQAGTGLYGPSKQLIKSKSGKALAFKSASGVTLFRRSVKGQQQRRMVPVKGLASPSWNKALKARAKAFLMKRLVKVAA